MTQVEVQSDTDPGYLPNRAEEDRAWSYLYRDANDPSVAAEVIEHLDAHPDVRCAHTALYLRCKRTVRHQRTQEARVRVIASAIRLAMTYVVVKPFHAIRSLLRAGTDVAAESLPQTRNEPAVRRVRRLQREPEIARAISEFGQATGATASVTPASGSRSARAA